MNADEYFLEFAKTASIRGTCPRLKVGAVLVSPNNVVVCTGYNGSPRGEPHCLDVSCLMEHGHCTRTVHAELNAIIQAARNGIKVEGCTLYITHSPCKECIKHIINAGIYRVVFAELYRMSGEQFEELLRRLHSVEVEAVLIDEHKML